MINPCPCKNKGEITREESEFKDGRNTGVSSTKRTGGASEAQVNEVSKHEQIMTTEALVTNDEPHKQRP